MSYLKSSVVTLALGAALTACGATASQSGTQPAAFSATTTPTATASPILQPTTNLTFSGAFSGSLADMKKLCSPAGTPSLTDYLEVTGTLETQRFTVRVYDPEGNPDFETGRWFWVSTPRPDGRSAYVWLTAFSDPHAAASSYVAHTSATVHAVTQPTVATDTQLGGANPYGALTISGSVIC